MTVVSFNHFRHAVIGGGRVFDGQPTHTVEGIDSFYGTVSVQSLVENRLWIQTRPGKKKKLPPRSEERHQDGYNLDQPGVILFFIIIFTRACK